MSKKGYAPIPGLHRVVEKELPLAVKVTGRHLGALAYLVSLAGERIGTPSGFGAVFTEDGSLESVLITVAKLDKAEHVTVYPGDVVYLFPGEKVITVSDAEAYDKLYRPIRLN